MTFDEFSRLAQEAFQKIPEAYREGIEGVTTVEAVEAHPELPGVVTLGECLTQAYHSDWQGPETVRSRVVLYYGSFRQIAQDDPHFDWSGTVNTRYAEPDPRLDIRNVRQRIFRGFCRDIDYGPIFQLFTEKREEMLSVVRDFDGLDEDRRDQVIEYWEDFFEIAADEGRHDRILRDCRRMPG